MEVLVSFVILYSSDLHYFPIPTSHEDMAPPVLQEERKLAREGIVFPVLHSRLGEGGRYS